MSEAPTQGDSPVFAVVGHPNKGKSSIVATLAQDDSVRIAPQSGTTMHRRDYPMRIDGKVMYTLVDTPGFQRPRAALAWMQERCAAADQRAQAVRAFVAAHRGTDRFTDECELLTPIIEGAGVIYVVDGSLPYGPEYEAEMEILRWTGQPTLALINPIANEDYIEPWEAALRQYFSIVRVFNAMTAEFHRRISLLRAFGELRDAWRPPLTKAAQSLEEDRKSRHAQAADVIATMLVDMLTETLEQRFKRDDDPAPIARRLNEKFLNRLRQREDRARRDVEAIFDWHDLDRNEAEVQIEDGDLFDTDNWYLWGISRTQLTARSAAAGAAAGGVIDLGVGGTSFLLGSAIGGLLGGATGWWGAGKLAGIKIGPLPLGGKVIRVGPIQHRNFPYVLLGRALAHHALVANRTHAQRGTLELPDQATDQATPQGWYDALDAATRKQLDQIIEQCRRATRTERTDYLHQVDEEPLTEQLNTILESRLNKVDQ